VEAGVEAGADQAVSGPGVVDDGRGSETVSNQTAAEVVESPETVTPLESGQEERVWTEVTGRISGLLREHVQRVDRIAISGPNRLDLVFAAEYDFHRRFCERPEVVRQLEELLQDVTGGVVQVRLIQEERKPEPEPAPEEQSKTNVEVIETDPMVEEAQNVFGATVQRVVPVNRPAVGE